jgi:hypothetical protein
MLLLCHFPKDGMVCSSDDESETPLSILQFSIQKVSSLITHKYSWASKPCNHIFKQKNRV